MEIINFIDKHITVITVIGATVFVTAVVCAAILFAFLLELLSKHGTNFLYFILLTTMNIVEFIKKTLDKLFGTDHGYVQPNGFPLNVDVLTPEHKPAYLPAFTNEEYVRVRSYAESRKDRLLAVAFIEIDDHYNDAKSMTLDVEKHRKAYYIAKQYVKRSLLANFYICYYGQVFEECDLVTLPK